MDCHLCFLSKGGHSSRTGNIWNPSQIWASDIPKEKAFKADIGRRKEATAQVSDTILDFWNMIYRICFQHVCVCESTENALYRTPMMMVRRLRRWSASVWRQMKRRQNDRLNAKRRIWQKRELNWKGLCLWGICLPAARRRSDGYLHHSISSRTLILKSSTYTNIPLWFSGSYVCVHWCGSSGNRPLPFSGLCSALSLLNSSCRN